MNLTITTLLKEVHPDICEQITKRGWPQSYPISLAILQLFRTKQKIMWKGLLEYSEDSKQIIPRLEQTLDEFSKIDFLVSEGNMGIKKMLGLENLMEKTHNIKKDGCWVSRIYALWSTGDQSILGIQELGITEDELNILFSGKVT